jgi:hypothetical protein
LSFPSHVIGATTQALGQQRAARRVFHAHSHRQAIAESIVIKNTTAHNRATLAIENHLRIRLASQIFV